METVDQNIYVISLDALDLNLLPTIYNTQADKIAPLWSRSNLDRRNNDYYRFEIKSTPCEGTVEDETPNLKLENVTCNICDIEVPRPFVSEHRKSVRHLTNMKIANIAVHRMKKYLNNTDDENSCTENDTILQSVYFCAVCVDIVDLKEKNSHEKSLAHKNSQVVEKLFNDFLNLYHHQEEIEESEAHNEKNTNKNDNKSFDSALNSTVNVHYTNNKNTPNVELKLTNQKPIDAISENERSRLEQPITMPLRDYLKMLNKSLLHPMVFTLHDDDKCLIEIETVDGSIVKVNENNFHSFSYVGKKHIKCHVCKETFKNKFIEKHKMSKKHIQYMTAPLLDKHCARQIDNSSNHCLICNIITEYSDIHSLCDVNHEVNLKESLISDKLLEDNRNIHQELGKENATAAEDYPVETNDEEGKWVKVTRNRRKVSIDNSCITNESQKMQNKYFCNSCNEIISVFRHSKHNKTAKHIFNSKSEYHYQMTEIENTLICKVCNVELTNDNSDVKKHVFDEAHFNKYVQILCENKIVLYCKACEQVILYKNELSHINTKRHQTNCFSVEYVVAVNENIEKETDKIVTGFFQCDVCDVTVPNNEHNIREHMDGRAHASNVGKTKPTSDDNDDYDIDEDDSNVETVHDIHYHLEPNKFSKLLKCKVCEIIVLQNEISITEHLASTEHIANYDKLLKDNYLVLTVNNYYCNICEVSVAVKSELMHVSGRKHNKMLKQHFESQIDSTVKISKCSSSTGSKVDEKNMSVYAPLVSNVIYNIDKPLVSNVKVINKTDLPSVSTVKDVNNINKPSVSYDKSINKTDVPSVSTVKAVNNINQPSVSYDKGINKTDLPSVSTVKAVNNINKPSVSYDKSINKTDVPSVSTVKAVNNINKPSVSYDKSINKTDVPSVSTVKAVNNINKASVSHDKGINKTDVPSVSTVRAVNNINKPPVSYNFKAVHNTYAQSVSNVKGINTSGSVSNLEEVITKDTSKPNKNLHPNVDIDPQMLAFFESTPNPKEVVCKSCKVSVPFNEYNISTHINGMKHKTLLSMDI